MERRDVYKCNLCGNIVEVLHVGGGELVCCGEPMEQLKANTTDAVLEKHVPVIEATDAGVTVKIGSVAHPMSNEHYIEWIELIADGASHLQFLSPGDEPQATFNVPAQGVTARAYCNLHGLWKHPMPQKK